MSVTHKGPYFKHAQSTCIVIMILTLCGGLEINSTCYTKKMFLNENYPIFHKRNIYQNQYLCFQCIA